MEEEAINLEWKGCKKVSRHTYIRFLFDVIICMLKIKLVDNRLCFKIY